MENLKIWREQNDLTIAQAAAKLGVAYGTWWRWEEGSRKPGLRAVINLTALTHIPQKQLRPDMWS